MPHTADTSKATRKKGSADKTASKQAKNEKKTGESLQVETGVERKSDIEDPS